jgi:hypothetical protein
VVVFAVVSVVVVVVSVVVVDCCVVVSVVLELIGAGVSTIVGAGVSTMTGAGAGVITVVSVVSTVAGDCVTTTFELLLFFGIRFTFVFVPIADPLPVPPAELLVYARPLLSTAAGPEITAGVGAVVTPSAFTGAGTVATVVVLLSAVAGASVRICP